jgi:hypothetical protein
VYLDCDELNQIWQDSVVYAPCALVLTLLCRYRATVLSSEAN